MSRLNVNRIKMYKMCKLCILMQMHIFIKYKGRHETKIGNCYPFLIEGSCRLFRSTRISHEGLEFAKTCFNERWHRTVQITFT